MGNASLEFIAYGLAVAVLFHAAPASFWRKIVLVAASLFFLATFSRGIVSFIPFAIFVLFGYAGFLLIRKAPERWFAPVVITTLVLFFWFKKYAFVPSGAFLTFPYLMLGMSYILFRMLHLMIQERYDPLTVPIDLTRYLCYTCNFLTLVSGPIQRYDEFIGQLDAAGWIHVPVTSVGESVERIIRGYFKAAVLALIFSSMQASALASGAHSVWDGVVIFGSYPLFLYCNFSGYIDIVIGISSLMGIRLPENFDRPFSCDSFIGFWSRWHITLSEWLRSYVYTPLLMGLMRRYPAPALQNTWAILAFFVTFFLIGVWHGQTAAFLFFGFLQGLGVSVNKLFQVRMGAWLGTKRYKALSREPVYVMLGRGLTFTYFAFTLAWFWADWAEIAKLERSFGWRELAIV
ncbi:MAG: hypothetical protein JO022_02920, partial [Acidobacteriaceae bacterium]|nr:hypothetical protein [Acidobacteriaceae bacterium]